MADAIRRFGGQPARLKQARFDAGRLLGYVEAHIEQGPVLEEENVAVGIVTAIAGQSRFQFTFTGRAGHAGTTPMRLRRDALCAAAEFILAVEDYAARKAGLVATVGQIQAEPNASNVIPGTVTLTLDVRHQTDSVRRAAGAQFSEARPADCRRAPGESFSAACAADPVGRLFPQTVRPAGARRQNASAPNRPLAQRGGPRRRHPRPDYPGGHVVHSVQRWYQSSSRRVGEQAGCAGRARGPERFSAAIGKRVWATLISFCAAGQW